MRLKSIELSGFKSFAKKTELKFDTPITAIVGPNGSGKSNIAESFRFVLGEQSMKSMRGRRGEDMIWNGSHAVPRAGRASVSLVLDNTDRALNLDFDEVSFERSVARDGVNEYKLNNSTVRLRDISELLANANIGASGHHIISQGEADRILSASSRDRREMIEDALGLTAYLYKREDAEKKLEKTAENMREAEALRRELSPHLRFLSGQVKKIEEGEQLRMQLSDLYLEYLKREHVHLKLAAAHIESESEGPTEEKRKIEERIAHLREEIEGKGKNDAASQELMRLESEGRTARTKREALTRELGRIEGEIAARERLSRVVQGGSIPAAEAASFAEEVARALEAALAADLSAIKASLSALISRAREFAARVSKESLGAAVQISEEESSARKVAIEADLSDIHAQEERIAGAVSALRLSIESEKDASRDAERELFAAMARRSELENILQRAAADRQMREREEESFKMEVVEAGALIGYAAQSYAEFNIADGSGGYLSDADIASEERGAQEARRRRVERLKIRVEEAGAGNAAEVLKEYQETTERDQFLERELADLAASAESLRALIAELTQTLEVRFSDGIQTITAQFDEFFKLMFGGGEAKLAIVKERKARRGAAQDTDDEDAEDAAEDSEYEEGIEVSISLPHKRVKGLHMLSGGERALTSIALIFAMSQVNPPPFLILDETDAALDEANSRRYGDMIERLSHHSQLILITHNRETMSRAGVLYGVTMGSDGVSKLLSVRFEEAVAVAK